MSKEKTVETKTIKEVWNYENKIIKRRLVEGVIFILLTIGSVAGFTTTKSIGFAVVTIMSMNVLLFILILLTMKYNYRNLMIGIKKDLGEEDDREVTFKE